MTAHESLGDKARRLLAEGRITVLRRVGDLVEAECQGDTGTYRLSHFPDRPGVWTCTCPAMGRCSHVAALELVIIPNTTERTSP